MKQLSVVSLKQRFNILSLQSSKLKLSHQMTKHRKTNLLRTFYFMSSKKCKRFVSYSEQDDSSQKEEIKKRKIVKDKEILSMSSYLTNFSSLDSKYSLINQYDDISSMKLMNA